MRSNSYCVHSHEKGKKINIDFVSAGIYKIFYGILRSFEQEINIAYMIYVKIDLLRREMSMKTLENLSSI